MSFCSVCRPKDDFPNHQLWPFILKHKNLPAISLLLKAWSATQFLLLRPSWDLHWPEGPKEPCLLFHSCDGCWNINRDSAIQDLRSHPTIWHTVYFHYDEYKGTVFTRLLCYILNQSMFLQGTGRICAGCLDVVKEHSFTNFSKVLPVYTSWERSSEMKGTGTMKEHRRPFLGSRFQMLCVQS